MIPSYPAHELPLDELLRFAAENRITAAIDLRSSITAGRIDIVHGEVVDAAFGGLICEAAVCAALDSKSLQVLRGRTPPRSLARRVRSSTTQILAEWKSRRDGASTRSHQQGSCSGSAVDASPSSGGDSTRRSLLRYLRLGAFIAALVALLGSVSYGAWSLSYASQSVQAGVPPTGRDPAEATACGQSVRELAARVVQTSIGAARESCSLVAQALVEDSGSVSGVRICSATDCSATQEEAAIQSLLTSRLEPAQCRGRFVASWAEIPIRFEDSSTISVVQNGKLARR